MKVIIMFLLLSCSFRCYANDSTVSKNTFYLELIGNGESPLCFNYERMLFYKQKVGFAFRGGLSFLENSYTQNTVYGIPLEIICLYGSKVNYRTNFIETSFGFTPFIGTSDLNDTLIPKSEKSNYNYSYFIRLGYRYVNKSGFTIRVAPVLAFDSNLPDSKKLNCFISYSICLGYFW